MTNNTDDNGEVIIDRTGAGALPTTYSSQQLMQSSDSESVGNGGDGRAAGGVDNNENRNHGTPLRLCHVSRSQWFTVTVLCFVNLINYMDRFTIAGVLEDIQRDFQIDNSYGGLLQTVFIISYMVCAPIFGYLGDRYSRRWIMAVGVVLWSATTLLGSFMKEFGWFITFRALVGIGEASYSTIAPTIISDLFVRGLRSKMLAVFYFAIPVGVIAAILILITKDPERGESEGGHNLRATAYKEDLKYLMKNRSFVFSTMAFTCVAFVTGALAWWSPTFIYQGLKLQPQNEDIGLNDVSFRFGAVTTASGILGVTVGSLLSQKLVEKHSFADPFICGIGLLVSTPLTVAAIVTVSFLTHVPFILILFAQFSLNLNWPILADILLYVVVPTRRSTAEAFQILISHTFGDAGSPYLIGLISEVIKRNLRSSSPNIANLVHSSNLNSLSLTLNETIHSTTSFYSLQYALFIVCFVEVLGGIFFLITAVFITEDKHEASQAAQGKLKCVKYSNNNKNVRRFRCGFNIGKNIETTECDKSSSAYYKIELCDIHELRPSV
uniref:Major facilitator superfamily (MFS) profile domain-containing protein n=1 Tax=Glossina pallidipes TaxID=7398 RepID=A0A1A9ZRF4_GLOPL